MTTDKTTNIKSLLRDECLPALNQSAAYFSMADVRAWLQQRGVACPPPVLRDYLSQFMRSRLIHDAGRGWYSRIASPRVLNAKPVARLARQVEQAFPLLDFACWSTEQVRSFGHLLLARFVAFIHTERDALASVADRLEMPATTSTSTHAERQPASSPSASARWSSAPGRRPSRAMATW